ncbi:iron-containing alcohol dehydrogenase [Vallitalea guaymasensis]|uniref:iron-containing alcohol dehydrogenase n=1 Tax=Vallitalea guaymasensis TaxID=1185412 RepID=UPI00272A34F0|nr:iron-containing alcohol dehydrogenase [Vallitalea guaymasensis]
MVNFNFAKVPQTIFHPGSINEIDSLHIVKSAKNILLVTGANSFRNSKHYRKLLEKMVNTNIYETRVVREPSPESIDNEVNKHKEHDIELVIAIGGGSVMDAGKAISAMLTQKDSVMAYIEGVGEGKIHNGDKIPLIAIPTTSGTGSETTKNAVLSKVGKKGFKKSIRHENFVPDIVMLDPELMINCPSNVTAASGLDALTQLIGSYVSTKGYPMTDALAVSGIEYFGKSFLSVCNEEYDSIEKRASMAYASYISGITLANAGLGIVHGFASSVGGYADIPHGVLCGTLLPEAVKLNIKLLQEQQDEIYLKKYAKVGAILTGSDEKDIDTSCKELVNILEYWINELKIPRLKEFGITEQDLDCIVKATNNKNNPVNLSNEQMKSILLSRL